MACPQGQCLHVLVQGASCCTGHHVLCGLHACTASAICLMTLDELICPVCILCACRLLLCCFICRGICSGLFIPFIIAVAEGGNQSNHYSHYYQYSHYGPHKLHIILCTALGAGLSCCTVSAPHSLANYAGKYKHMRRKKHCNAWDGPAGHACTSLNLFHKCKAAGILVRSLPQCRK